MNTLQMLREAAGYFTPEELAVKAGVSNNTVRRAERGYRITRQSALRLARALNRLPEEIDGLQFVGKEQSIVRTADCLEDT